MILGAWDVTAPFTTDHHHEMSLAILAAQHKSQLTLLTLALHALVAVWIIAAASLPSFDSSASVAVDTVWEKALLRWDTFHFLHIAQADYFFEHEHAFFPGTPTVMRWCSNALIAIVRTGDETWTFLLGGHIATVAACVGSVHTLYDLTLHQYKSPSVALLASLLSLLSSSPATLRFAPYAEPFFTFLSYKGMLYYSQHKFLHAAFYFCFASMFRSNGVMLAGFIVWGMTTEPFLSSFWDHDNTRRRIDWLRAGCCIALSTFPALPFIVEQFVGFRTFCTSTEPRPWCSDRLPVIYSFIQSEYWNVGLFRYWTIDQAPNILLAIPIISLLFGSAIRDITRAFIIIARARLANQHAISEQLTLVPYAVHAFALATSLLIGAHTQIALRFAAALPYTYWSAASLFLEMTTLKTQPQEARGGGKDTENDQLAGLWVGWSVVWGAISLVTWGTFLPPA